MIRDLLRAGSIQRGLDILSLPRATRRHLLRLDQNLAAAERRADEAIARCDAWGEIERLERARYRLVETFASAALEAMQGNPLAAAMFALELPDADTITAEDPVATVARFRRWLKPDGEQQ